MAETRYSGEFNMETFMQKYIKNLDISTLVAANSSEQIIADYLDYYQTDIKDKILFENSIWNPVCNDICNKTVSQLRNALNNKSFDKINSIVCAIRDSKSTSQKKEFLPLLCVIDHECSLTKQLLQNGFFDDLLDVFKVALSGIHGCDISTTSSLPAFDRHNEIIKRYHSAIAENNFQEIAVVLENLEIGDQLEQCCFNPYMSLTGFVVAQKDIEFINSLCANKNILLFIKMFYKIGVDEKLSIAYQINNNLIKAEVLREIADIEIYQNTTLHMAAELIKQLASDKQSWDNVLKFFLKYHCRNGVFWNAAGYVFCELDETSRKNFINNIKVTFSNQPDKKNYIGEFWNNISDQKIKESTAAKLFWRMKKTLNAELPLNVYGSNIFDVAVSYLIKLPEKGIEKRIMAIINQLNTVDSIWFEDSSSQRRFFYTKVNILVILACVACKNKWERILNKIECYINSSFLWKYEKYMGYGNLSIFDNILKKQ